ncbi:glucosaminidase domain-containing protein [Clostridium tertium]|uniref:glucosaminidase domain-containing protein n=1 Tax=Clostridium tertium TaxID=1559 RepID=UPI00232D7464|nr:glucosaminidase domain-containing protein [Clostridium tertium]MDB1921716.1 glucosaminidase domain-containing protein [Clostridium tertium]MDB1924919.1 glucosaminidase domain-containing protein [Clostridium tertium]MDB1929558.1 glucosaminidase domain-containing protein [Clostridium tertium]
MKKGKIILSLVLSVFMLFPSIATAAEEVNSIVNNAKNIESHTTSNVAEITEEGSISNLEALNSDLHDSNTVNEENHIEKEFNDLGEKDGFIEESSKLESNIETIVDSDDLKEENSIEYQESALDEFNSVNDDNNLIGEVYQEINKPMFYSARSYNSYEREEFNLKAEAISSITLLDKKTDSDYEIALAYSDGSYTYLDSTDNIDSAIDIVNYIDSEPNNGMRTMSLDSDDNTIPVVINKSGQVVYSTNSMGRILKHIGGEVYPYFDKNTQLYSDSGLTVESAAYINQGYVDDVPIIEDRGRSALIQVSGYKGWINKDSSSGNYEMIVVPMNQVKNPSYYSVSGGILKHFISTDITSTIEKGTTLQVGAAPSFLSEGVKYYSYDGIYFYNDLNSLISDLKGGHNGNSVNSNQPFYSYYKYLPLRSTTKFTATELDRFISENTISSSKLRGSGQAFINAQNTYGVNALIMLAISINESGWGISSISQNKNNIFGINAVDSNPGQAADAFNSVKECINEFAKNWMSVGYLDPGDWRYHGGSLGDKSLGINVKYASDPFWGEKAAQYMFKADNSLSGSVTKLREYNSYQLALFSSSASVKNSNGEHLYNSRAGSTAVVTRSYEVGGLYQIYADINIPRSLGNFNGTYDWQLKGNVEASKVVFINQGKNNVLEYDPSKKHTWVEVQGKHYYYDGNGYLVKGWTKQNGKWYYLDLESGEMKTGWLKLGQSTYYFFADGGMATGLTQINNHKYFFNDLGEMVTGWSLINGKWYYFNSNGQREIGWLLQNGVWYYLDNDGVMLTGLNKIGNHKYYFSGSGAMQTGWKLIENNWYYFHGSGDAKIGWLQSGSIWYYLSDSGAMVTGLNQIGEHKYFFDASGVMQTGWQLINNNWYYFHGSGDARKGWLFVGDIWYFLGEDSIMVTGWQEIGGKKYYFNGSGMMYANTYVDGIWLDEDGAAIS